MLADERFKLFLDLLVGQADRLYVFPHAILTFPARSRSRASERFEDLYNRGRVRVRIGVGTLES